MQNVIGRRIRKSFCPSKWLLLFVLSLYSGLVFSSGNQITLGFFGNKQQAESAMNSALSKFYKCNDGAYWAGFANGLPVRGLIVNGCYFAKSYDWKYDFSVYWYESGQCLTFSGVNGMCAEFYDPTKFGPGESNAPLCGNPIDLSNGIKVQSVTDYSLSSNSLLKFTRVYSSRTGTWLFPFLQKMTQRQSASGNGYIVYKPLTVDNLGHGITWETISVTNSPDEYISLTRPNGSEYLLSRYSFNENSYKATSNGVAGYVKKLVDGWAYIEGLTTETYNASGRLIRIENPSGKLGISYDDSTGAVVYTDNYGNTLTKTPLGGDDFKISDNAGYEITYKFVNGKLITVRYSDGSSVTYHYENTSFPQSLTGITDEEGKRFASWTYDSNGKANMSSHANNAERINLIYNADNTVSASNISGKKATYHFENTGGRNRVTQVEGHSTASCLAADSYYSYDENGFRKTFTDKNGNVTETIRNSRGLVETERTGLKWSGAVNSTLLETTASQKTVTVWHETLALPLTHTYYGWNGSGYESYKQEATTYTANNRIATFTVTDLSTITEPYNTYGRTHVWTYNYSYYDSDQTQLQQQTVNGPRTDVIDVTTYNYDIKGNLSSTVNALNHTVTFSDYNARGLVGNITDANANTTNLTYTLRGLLHVITVNGTALNTYDYYANGLLQKVTLPDGSWLSYFYNDARHLIKVENNLGESIAYAPNLLDGQWTHEVVKDGSNVIVRQRARVFDELGRVMILQGQHGQSWHYSYDKNDNLENENDALEQVTSYQYDAQNRVSETLDAEQNAKPELADQHPVAFAYDGQGNVKTVTDQRGNTTRYLYDGFGELIQQTSPDTGVTQFTYDAAGNLISKTDARLVNVAYQFDVLNRLTAQLHVGNPAEDIRYTYDATANGSKGIGHLSGYSDSNGTTILSYDAWGLHEEIYCLANVQCYNTQSIHNNMGQLTELVYPSGNSVIYHYDILGRVDAVSYRQSGEPEQVIASAIEYSPFGPMKKISFANGMQLNLDKDSDGRLTTLTATGTASLYSKTYGHTLSNNINTITDLVSNQNNRAYTYDKLSRLTSATKGVTNPITSSYSYDETGNRTTKKVKNNADVTSVNESLDYDAGSNRLSAISDSVTGVDKTYTYDAAGNITLQAQGQGGSVAYTYNDGNRMSVSNVVDGSTTSYVYNALGQRIIKIPDGTFSEATYYNYNGSGQLLAEHNMESMQLLVENIYVNGIMLAQMDAHKNDLNSDSDSDNDGWLDVDELACGSDSHNNISIPSDTDGDLQCNTVDADDDNDLIADTSDACPAGFTGVGDDLDADGCKNSEDGDDDSDSLADDNDRCPLGAIGSGNDWDNDGCKDAEDPDDDNDGLSDLKDACSLGITGMDSDMDNDGCKNPEDADDDNDGIMDAQDTDDDNDGVPDLVEIANGLDINNPLDAMPDTDGDGYSLGQELVQGSNPNTLLSVPASEQYSIAIEDGKNDVESAASGGSLRIADTVLDLSTGTSNLAGLRFTLPLRKGAQIISAVLEFVYLGGSGNTVININLENTIDAALPASSFTNRSYFPDTVIWKAASNGCMVNNTCQSVNVSTLINKVVGRPDWVENKHLFFKLSRQPAGSKQFAAYEKSPAKAAKLKISAARTKWDNDNDGVVDSIDNCPLLANTNQLNTDGDSRGDVCDAYPANPAMF